MFSRLGLSPTACASLARLGYDTPTPIQTEAIPLVLSGVDLLGRAETGTGKTAAFGLPMIDRLLALETGYGRRIPRACPPGNWPSRSMKRWRPSPPRRLCGSPPSSAASR